MGNGGGDGPGGIGEPGGPGNIGGIGPQGPDGSMGAGIGGVNGPDGFGGVGGGPGEVYVQNETAPGAQWANPTLPMFTIDPNQVANDIALGSGWGIPTQQPYMSSIGRGSAGNVFSTANPNGLPPMAGWSNPQPFSYQNYMGGFK